jgi:hypothetical protein
MSARCPVCPKADVDPRSCDVAKSAPDDEIKYSTVQNWYPGEAEGRGGIFNFVTKRGDCRGARARISWTQ